MSRIIGCTTPALAPDAVRIAFSDVARVARQTSPFTVSSECVMIGASSTTATSISWSASTSHGDGP